MQYFVRHYKNARYLLTVIDMFSKFAWVAPVKLKDADAVTEAFRQNFKSAALRHPNRLYTDQGKEFINATVIAMVIR